MESEMGLMKAMIAGMNKTLGARGWKSCIIGMDRTEEYLYQVDGPLLNVNIPQSANGHYAGMARYPMG